MPPSRKNNLHVLYERHARELHAFARQRVGADEAADVVQDTYLRVLQYADHGALKNPRAYLYRIAANACIDRGLGIAARAERIEPEVDPDTLHAPAPEPEAIADSRNRLQLCLAALEELSPVYRHVFLLHRIDGLSQSEVADALSIPKRTVERYIAKTLAHCLAKLDR
jgi:RNA polymerase sigma-70 factor (ECF subfamily)